MLISLITVMFILTHKLQNFSFVHEIQNRNIFIEMNIIVELILFSATQQSTTETVLEKFLNCQATMIDNLSKC